MDGNEEALKEMLAAVTRAWMDHANRSVQSVADEVEISRNTIYAILKKERLPEVGTLDKVARALGATASKFLDGVYPATTAPITQPATAAFVTVAQMQEIRADLEDRMLALEDRLIARIESSVVLSAQQQSEPAANRSRSKT